MATVWPREQIYAALNNNNVQAMGHVAREGETDQTPLAYYRVNGRPSLTSLAQHPYYGQPSPPGRASGAYQHLGTTWSRIAERYPKDVTDFSAQSQDFAFVVGLFDRGAIQAVMNGQLELAIRLLRDEWVSLPGLGMERAARVFKQYGGTMTGETQPAAPIEDHSTQAQPSGETTMGPLVLAGIFGEVLKALIPQVGKLFGGQKDAQNAQAIGTVFDTIVTATGQALPADVGKVGTAIQLMQDAEVKNAVTKAVVTEPSLMAILEVGGGVTKAREFDVVTQQQEKPFYKTSAVFWMSVILIPIVYWLVGSLIIGGTAFKLITMANGYGVTIPPWIILLLSVFGDVWQGETRSGGFNLIVGLILGGICGVYYGVSVTQAKQAAQQQQTSVTGG